MKKSSRKIEKIINAPINEAFLTNVYFGGVNLLNADLFRLIDYNLTDEEFEDFKRRGDREYECQINMMVDLLH